MKLLVATRNRGKIIELEKLFADLPVELVGLDAFEDVPEVVEDRDDFEGNATKKAHELSRFCGLPTVADDSGIEVDALGRAPGVYSARYAGEQCDDEANNDLMLRELEGVPDEKRTGRFRCALAFVDPEGPLAEAAHVEHGVIEGTILRARRGEGGFGYDPLFLPIGETRTTAEMQAADKNAISHRADASRKMCEFLRVYLRERDE